MKHLWTILLLISTTLSCPDLDEYCAQCSGKGHSQCKLCYGAYLLEGECVSVARKHALCQVRNPNCSYNRLLTLSIIQLIDRVLAWLSQANKRQYYDYSIGLKSILFLIHNSDEITLKKEYFNIFIDIFT